MDFWGWVQAIAVGWFVLSILLAVAWALVGRRVFRTRGRLDELGAARVRKAGA